MLTHVFKPRWLVLILLSAGNRECRWRARARETEEDGSDGREGSQRPLGERGKDEDEKDGKEEDGRRMEEGASS